MRCSLNMEAVLSCSSLVSGSEAMCMGSMSVTGGVGGGIRVSSSSMSDCGRLAAVRGALVLLVARFCVMVTVVFGFKRYFSNLKAKTAR